MPADLVLLDANVRTLNLSQPVAEAVAISKNRIVKVGTNNEVEPFIGKQTKVLRLEGKTVVPGLIDTHIHVADFGRCLMWLDLTAAQSVIDVRRLLIEKAQRTPAGGWIVGRGWNETRFKEKRFLNRLDLDEVAPDNPVILYHEAAMICVTNSKALSQAKVNKQTITPPAGTIDRNPQTGELTGILRDSATNLVWQAVPEPSVEELTEATAVACRELVKAGLTSVDWIILSENELQIIQRLHEQDRLLVRVNVIVPETFLKQAANIHSGDPLKLRVGGAIIFCDGYLDSKTAALSQPYSDEPANSGKLNYTPEALESSVEQILAAGLQPVVHAMGDSAVDMVLRLVEQTSQRGVRFRIEQAAVLNKALIERLKAINAVVTVQPKVVSTEFAVWQATEHLGVERAQWLHPLKTLIEAGVKVGGGSDCPMEPLSPMLGMQELVTRQSFSEQRLSVEEALRMYTLDSAYASGEEEEKGSIEEGKLADLTILSSDPVGVEPGQIKDTFICMVIIGCKVFSFMNN